MRIPHRDDRPLVCFSRYLDIIFHGTGKPTYRYFLHRFGHFHHSFEITRRRNRESRFNDIDAQFFQSPGDDDLFSAC